MATPLRVLIVEDSEDDAALVVRELQRGGFDVSYQRVDTATVMNTALEAQEWDLAHFSFIILVKDTAMDHVLGSSVRFAVLSTALFPAE